MRRWIGFMAGVVALVAGNLSDAHERPTRADLMADAAKAFIENLTEEQKAIALRRLDDEHARTSWHYLPEDMTTRSGITLAQLAPDQRKAVHAMLVAALSSQGYGKLTHIMWLEEVLRASEGGRLEDHHGARSSP